MVTNVMTYTFGFYVMTSTIDYHYDRLTRKEKHINKNNNTTTTNFVRPIRCHYSIVSINHHYFLLITIPQPLLCCAHYSTMIYTCRNITSHVDYDGLSRTCRCCNDSLCTSFWDCVFSNILL